MPFEEKSLERDENLNGILIEVFDMNRVVIYEVLLDGF
jgi:hypothetical protein